VFDGETIVDVDVDTLGEDAVWQEEEELGEDKVEQAYGQLEELQVQSESKWPAHYVGNPERSKRRHRQKQRKAAVGTKKLTSFFAPVVNGDNSNKDNEQHDTYLALTLKLPINPCGQIWAAPAKFGRKSSISTDIISAKKKDFDKRVA